MALTRNALDNFYAERKPYLEEIIGMDFMEHPSIYSQFCNMKSASGGWVDFATVSGFGLFQSKAELVDAASDDILQGPVARAAVVTYAKQHLVSQEAIEDDEGDNIINSRLPQILRAGRATQEVLAHDLLNGAATSVTTPDGAYLVSDAHVTLSGGTGDNKATAALSEAALEAAILQLEGQVDDRNIPIYQTAAKIVVPNGLKFTASSILESTLKTRASGAGTNDAYSNEANPLYGMGIQVVTSQFLTDANDWFLLGSEHGLNWYWRIQPENWSEPDYIKSGIRVGARFRCASAATDWRGIVGSIVA